MTEIRSGRVHIKPYEPQYFESYKEALQEGGTYDSKRDTREKFDRHAAQYPGAITVATHKDKFVGGIVVGRSPYAFASRHVFPEGEGGEVIGEQLIKRAESLAKGNKHRELEVALDLSTPAGQRAQSLYRALGWADWGEFISLRTSLPWVDEHDYVPSPARLRRYNPGSERDYREYRDLLTEGEILVPKIDTPIRFADHVAQFSDGLWLANVEGEGKVQGGVLLDLQSPDPEAWRVAVSIAMRQRHIGRDMMRHAAGIAYKMGHTELEISLDPDNTLAKSFYMSRRLGFRDYGTRRSMGKSLIKE